MYQTPTICVFLANLYQDETICMFLKLCVFGQFVLNTKSNCVFLAKSDTYEYYEYNMK